MAKDIIIAAGPVIVENNKVLLVKHGDDNLWKFPGGKVNPEDTKDWPNCLEKTARREAREELNIDIKIIKTLKAMYLPKPNDTNGCVVLVHFLAKRIGNIRPAADIKQYKWWAIDNLPDDISPNIKPVVASL